MTGLPHPRRVNPSLADGFALRMLSEPERDFSATIAAGIACARGLLSD